MWKEFLEPPEAHCARMESYLFIENALFFIFIEVEWTMTLSWKNFQDLPQKNMISWLSLESWLRGGCRNKDKCLSIESKRIISIEYLDYITSLLRALTWRLEYYRSNYLHVEFISKNKSKKQVNQGNFCTKQWLTHAGWQKMPKDIEHVY